MDPTILFVAEHATGHRYLGKTRRISLFEQGKYTGSGPEWLRHKEEYGDDVSIISHSTPFTDEDEIREFAEFLSEELDIVASDLYLNKKTETGLDGGSSSEVYTPAMRKQMSESASARAGAHTVAHLNTPEVIARMRKPKSKLPPKKSCRHGCGTEHRPNTLVAHERSCLFNPINKRDCPVCGKRITNHRTKTCSTSCGNVQRGKRWTIEK